MCLSIHPSILSFPSPPGQPFDRNGNIALYLFTGRKVKVDLEEITQHAIAVEIQHVPLSRHISEKPLGNSVIHAFRTMHPFTEVHVPAVQPHYQHYHQQASADIERVRPPAAVPQPAHISGIACLSLETGEEATQHLLHASATAAEAAAIFGDLNQGPSLGAPSCSVSFPTPPSSLPASSATATQEKHRPKGSTSSPSPSQQKQTISAPGQVPPAIVPWSPHSSEETCSVPVFHEEEMLVIFGDMSD